METKKETYKDVKTRYEELMNKEYKIGDLAIGTIQMREGICGKANCKCKKGEPHGPYPYLAFSSKTKKRVISVKKDTTQELLEISLLKKTILTCYILSFLKKIRNQERMR